MSIFKRVEVWILLVLAVAGVAYVVVTSGRDGERGGGSGGGASGKVVVESIELTRDYSNGRLDVEVTYDNRGGGEVQSLPPDTRLLTGEGDEVDTFFLAGDFPPALPSGRRGTVTLKYWLQPEHFGKALTLDIRGDRAEVKSGRPFDITEVENGATVELDGPEWEARD